MLVLRKVLLPIRSTRRNKLQTSGWQTFMARFKTATFHWRASTWTDWSLAMQQIAPQTSLTLVVMNWASSLLKQQARAALESTEVSSSVNFTFSTLDFESSTLSRASKNFRVQVRFSRKASRCASRCFKHKEIARDGKTTSILDKLKKGCNNFYKLPLQPSSKALEHDKNIEKFSITPSYSNPGGRLENSHCTATIVRIFITNNI